MCKPRQHYQDRVTGMDNEIRLAISHLQIGIYDKDDTLAHLYSALEMIQKLQGVGEIVEQMAKTQNTVTEDDLIGNGNKEVLIVLTRIDEICTHRNGLLCYHSPNVHATPCLDMTLCPKDSVMPVNSSLGAPADAMTSMVDDTLRRA